MTKETALNDLVSKFGKQEWFHSAAIEPTFNRDLVIYAKQMNEQVLKAVPDKVEKFPVLLHFAAYKEAESTRFALPTALISPKETLIEALISKAEEIEEEVEELDDLVYTLWSLKKICGQANLKSIFFEVHDKTVKTKISEEFLEVRKEIERLYAELGFDVLFDEINQ